MVWFSKTFNSELFLQLQGFRELHLDFKIFEKSYLSRRHLLLHQMLLVQAGEGAGPSSVKSFQTGS